MEETIGKRIAFHRRRLGLTQDALAERLGITAQAVSKWENDLSCPDISMLPRLAEIFAVTTDELLGVAPPAVPSLPPEGPGAAPEDPAEAGWNQSRRVPVGIALWILLAGILLFLAQLSVHSYSREAGLWRILWTTGLVVYGLFGLYPRFSFFRLGCALFGGWGLAGSLGLLIGSPSTYALISLFFIYCGIALLGNALRGSTPNLHWNHRDARTESMEYNIEEGRFHCTLRFGERRQQIQLPRLAGGTAQAAFGSLVLDLQDCREFAPGCKLDLDCSFGSVEVHVPRSCRVDCAASTTFGSVEVHGTPAPEASAVLSMTGKASFGAIAVFYH